MEDHDISEMLARLGEALSSGNPSAVADCWAIPGLVLSDEGTRPVTSREEVERFFADAIAWYRSQGITSTKATLERVDHISKGIAAVDVLWPGFDATGQRKGNAERSHYLLHAGAEGRPRIRVALARSSAAQ
jgi:hypothetical protein